jgi:hypothetical protein
MISLDRFMTMTRITPSTLGVLTQNVRLRAFGGVALMLVGGMGVAKANPLSSGDVDPKSAVAAEVRDAEHAPGPYPRFSRLPTMPTDVRTLAAWRAAIQGEWAIKRQTEQAAAAIPFTLNDSETWAAAARARVSPDMSREAPADTADQSEAFAAAERARATPPPSSK